MNINDLLQSPPDLSGLSRNAISVYGDGGQKRLSDLAAGVADELVDVGVATVQSPGEKYASLQVVRYSPLYNRVGKSDAGQAVLVADVSDSSYDGVLLVACGNATIYAAGNSRWPLPRFRVDVRDPQGRTDCDSDTCLLARFELESMTPTDFLAGTTEYAAVLRDPAWYPHDANLDELLGGNDPRYVPPRTEGLAAMDGRPVKVTVIHRSAVLDAAES